MDSSSFKSIVTIYVPWSGLVLEQEVDKSALVSDLIKKILKSIGILDQTNYFLYGYGENFTKIPSNKSCSFFFMNNYEKIFLLANELITVTVYYENKRALIGYDPKSVASALLKTAISCFSIPISSSYYVLFDPVNNCIIPLQKPCNSRLLVIKSFAFTTQSVAFNVNAFPNLQHEELLEISILSDLVFKKPLLKMFDNIKSRSLENSFQICQMSPAQIEKGFKFLNGEDIELSPIEENSLLLMVLCSSHEPFIPRNLHEFAILIMQSQNDVEIIEMISVFLTYLPLESHMVYLELAQIFGGAANISAYRNHIMLVLTRIFFRRTINQELELKFILYLFTFYQLFIGSCLKPARVSEVRVFQEKLILYERYGHGYVSLRPEGLVNISYNATTPFSMDLQINKLLLKYAFNGENPQKTEDIQNAFKLLNTKKRQVFEKIANLQKNFLKE